MIGLVVMLGLAAGVVVVGRLHVRIGEFLGNYAFLAFFSAYTAGAVAWLLVGLTPAIADAFPSIQARLFDIGDGTAGLPRWIERMAEGAAIAASGVHDDKFGLEGRQPGGLVALEYVFSAVNIALGVFLVCLRPRDWTARFLAIGMVGTGAVYNLQAHTSHEIMPAILVENTHDNFHLMAGVAYIFALLRFPDGRFAPHVGELHGLQRVVLYVAAAFLLFVAFIIVSSFHGAPEGFVAFFGVLIPIAGVASQVTRFRHANTAEERQQSRLLLASLTLVFVVAVVFAIPLLVLSESGPHVSEAARDQISRVLFRVFPPLFAIIPITLFLVMVRYRLWDIDRIIHRTLVYGVLTAGLGAMYFGLVVGLQAALRPVSGGSDLAIVATTLVVAAVFLPARRQVQDAVDRRFNRRAYDAARTIEAFNARLREQIDLDTLHHELLAVVHETMQPARAGLWLLPAEKQR